MGSRDSQAYLASPEIVAASALSGKISGPNFYQRPEGWTGVEFGEGDGIKEEDRMITADQALEVMVQPSCRHYIVVIADRGANSES